MTFPFTERPTDPLSAFAQITATRKAFNDTWQSSKFHYNADPAVRALIANIYDDMKRLESVLAYAAKADKDEDKRFATAASVMADPTANTDLLDD